MEMRAVGNTGMTASVVGLGAEHLDNQPPELAVEAIHAALDHGVNIIDVFMPGEAVRTNIARLDPANAPPSVKSHYAAIKAHGADCLACGSCEERCPFGAPVMDNLQDAATLFGF